MARGLLGKKLGMSQVFDQEGNLVPVTVLELGPNHIIQVKTSDGKDGYNAIKVGYGSRKITKVNKPELAVFKNAGVDPTEVIREFRVDGEFIADYNVGDELGVAMFQPGEKLDVTGLSKGRGFQGVVKRHGFKGAKEMTHGTHEYKRHSGSIGMSADPARVIKGKRMPGQMGNDRVTVRGLTVVAIFVEENILMVKGAVPGAKNSIVEARVSSNQPEMI
jgi:large subunit ribosomal protein L3